MQTRAVAPPRARHGAARPAPGRRHPARPRDLRRVPHEPARLARQACSEPRSEAAGQLFADDQQRQRRRDIDAMQPPPRRARRRGGPRDRRDHRAVRRREAAHHRRGGRVRPHPRRRRRDGRADGAPTAAADVHAERRRAAPAVAGTGRHRRPVPRDPSAEAGLAQRHPRLPFDHADRFDALVDARKDVRGRLGGPRPRPRQRGSARRLPHRPRQVGRDRPARRRRAGPSRCSGAPSPASRPSRPTGRSPSPRRPRSSAADGIGALVHVVDPADSLRQTPERPVGRDADRPARSAAARERRRDRHRHRRPLVGPRLRRAKARWRPPASSTR